MRVSVSLGSIQSIRVAIEILKEFTRFHGTQLWEPVDSGSGAGGEICQACSLQGKDDIHFRRPQGRDIGIYLR